MTQLDDPFAEFPSAHCKINAIQFSKWRQKWEPKIREWRQKAARSLK